MTKVLPLRCVAFYQGIRFPRSLKVGWGTLENGDLLRSAEKDGYELLVTTDQNLKYQQNLKARKITIVVLLSTSWPRIQAKVEGVVRAVDDSFAGSYTEVAV